MNELLREGNNLTENVLDNYYQGYYHTFIWVNRGGNSRGSEESGCPDPSQNPQKVIRQAAQWGDMWNHFYKCDRDTLGQD